MFTQHCVLLFVIVVGFAQISQLAQLCFTTWKERRWCLEKNTYRPIALTSQILRVSSRCSLTISVRVQQPHTAQKLTILI
jgi:hypothetical protein